MNLIKQPNRWSCSVASLAMVIDQPIKDIIKVIGHDGSAVSHPEKLESDPLRYTGFHLQEIVDAAMWYGYRPVWIELEPVAVVGSLNIPIHFHRWRFVKEDIEIAPTCELPGNLARLKYYMNRFAGMILGENYHCCHWVAWGDGLFYDPRGTILKSLDMDVLGFLAISNH